MGVFSKYSKTLGILGFIFIKIILGSETPKSPAQLWYKIHVVYVGHTKTTPGRRKKCSHYFGPEGVYSYYIIMSLNL